MKKKKGFTLVELLAVIVILAVILIIAVPRISEVINNSKKASFEATAKTIANQAEKKYMENEVLGNTGSFECSDVAKINSTDYASCTITFDTNGNALVTINGSGKFAGLTINNATKNSATATELIETAAKWFSYVDIEGGISIIDYNLGYNVDVTVVDQSKCESYFTSDDQGFTQEEATTLCTGGDLGGYSLKDTVQEWTILQSDYETAGLTVKWLDAYVDGGGEDVVMPSTIDGKIVVAIAENAFNGKSIKSVVIPNSVTSIGESAFIGNQLTSITIPDSVTSIGRYAFNSNKLTSIVIPSSVTSIDDSAFQDNYLTSITIPNSVTSIGQYAFRGNQLTSITIPNSVTSIGKGAFAISCSTYSRVGSIYTCTKVGENDNPNLSKIVNKTGKSFDWDLIINNSSKGRYTFAYGDVVSDNKENHIVSIVSE